MRRTNKLEERIKDKLELYSRYVVIIILLLLGTSLYRSAAKNISVRERIEEELASIEDLKEENLRLKREVENVSTEKFVELKLRDELGLAKEGEYVVVLPDAETLKKIAPKLESEEETLPHPNWKKWAQLFDFI